MARKIGSHSDITGPRVRAAALTLFAREGYAAVSMRQLAAEVGLQAGALYLYTPDKQSLLADMLREHLQALLSDWAAVPQGQGPVQALEAFCRFHLRFHLANPEAVRIVAMEQRNLSPENLAEIAGLLGQYELALETILRAGHASGDFRLAEPRIAAKALIAMLDGVGGWYQEGGRLSQERVERIYWNLMRRAVGA